MMRSREDELVLNVLSSLAYRVAGAGSKNATGSTSAHPALVAAVPHYSSCSPSPPRAAAWLPPSTRIARSAWRHLPRRVTQPDQACTSSGSQVRLAPRRFQFVAPVAIAAPSPTVAAPGDRGVSGPRRGPLLHSKPRHLSCSRSGGVSCHCCRSSVGRQPSDWVDEVEQIWSTASAAAKWGRRLLQAGGSVGGVWVG